MSKRAPDYEVFKGHDLIRIYTGKTFTDKNNVEQEESICFGVRKAQAICDNIDAIRNFAKKGDDHENTPF